MQALGAGSQFANLPECDNAEIIGAFYDIGFVIKSEIVKPLTFSEIAGFKVSTGLNLNYAESVALKKMSESFVVWLNKGKDQGCAAPFYKDNRSVEDMRLEVTEKFKALSRKHK